MNKVSGAIEGVNNPLPTGIVAFAFHKAAFFGEKAVVRVGALQGINNQSFAGAVHLGHKIIMAFLLYGDMADIVNMAAQILTGTWGRTLGDIYLWGGTLSLVTLTTMGV